MAIKKKIITIETNSNNTLLALRVNCDEFSFIEILQHELSIDFKIQKPHEYELSSGATTIHASYSGYDETRKLRLDVIANKTDKGALIDFMDSIDFFIQFSALYIPIDEIQQTVQKIQTVLYAQKIDIHKFSVKQQKYISNLFF